MDNAVSLAERLGTAGILAAVLLIIMYARERQFRQERTEWREDLDRAFALSRSVLDDLRDVMEKTTTSIESMRSWLQGKLG